MNQHVSSCVLAPANIVKVTLEIRKALIIPMWGPYPRQPADLKILLADMYTKFCVISAFQLCQEKSLQKRRE